METDLDWGRLGRIVRAARGARSQQDIRENGGPSDETLSKIEQGNYKPTRSVQSTLEKLDKGFGWAPGSAHAVLAGGDPRPAVTSDDLDDESVRLRIQLAHLRNQAAHSGDQTAEWDIQKRLDVIGLQRAQLERQARHDPLVELVVDGHQLAVQKADIDVSAYVRKVESAVVGVMGLEALTTAVSTRTKSTEGKDRVVEAEAQSPAPAETVKDEEVSDPDVSDEVKPRGPSVADLLGSRREKPGETHSG